MNKTKGSKILGQQRCGAESMIISGR